MNPKNSTTEIINLDHLLENATNKKNALKKIILELKDVERKRKDETQ